MTGRKEKLNTQKLRQLRIVLRLINYSYTRRLFIFVTPATESGRLKTCLWRFCKWCVCVLAVISWHFPLSKNYVNCKFLFKIHFWLYDILTLVSWSRQLPSCCRGEMRQLEFRSPTTIRWNFVRSHYLFLFPVIVKVNLKIFGDTPAKERPCTSPDSVCDRRTTQWMMQDKQFF